MRPAEAAAAHSSDEHDGDEDPRDDAPGDSDENQDGDEDDEAMQQEEAQAEAAAAASSRSQFASTASSLPAAQPAVDTSTVYAAFGRDTPAGRALYKLYNKNKTAYSPNVAVPVAPGGRPDPLEEFRAKRAAEAAALKKPTYKPPRLKKAEKEAEVGRVPLYGGKKTTHSIDREEERDRHLYKAPTVPLAVLQRREQSKLRLQEAMEGKKAAPIKPLPGRGPARPLVPRKDPNQQLQDDLINDIEERTQFLDQMREMGDLTHEAAVKAEIATKLRDLKRLEQLMQEEQNEAGPSSRAAAAPAR